MLADLFASCLAFVLFSCLTILPGYTLGWLLNALRFRQRELTFRFAISVPLSIALGPLISYFVGRRISLEAAGAVYLLLSIAAVPLIIGAWRRCALKMRLWVLGAWCLLALLALCDLQIGHRLYFSVIGFDYAVRTAFVSSISTFGLPARNPFFYPNHPVGLRYHYFWLIQSALIQKVAGRWIDARQAFIGGTMWCGIGLISTIALYLRFFKIRSAKNVFVLAVGLLTVTGLDIIPGLFFFTLVKLKLIGMLPPSMEWWNEQVDGWVYTMLWEPHYVAGLIAGLFGFLVISQARGARSQLALSGALAGLAFATSVGAAIYIAFVFAIFLFVWSAVVLLKRWRQEFFVLAIAGITATLFSLPFLAGLRGPGAGGAFLHFTVRTFFVIDVLGKMLHFAQPWQWTIAYLLALPLNYFIELGFFFAVGILEWRRLRGLSFVPRHDLSLAIMALVSITVCTFLRSGVITNNDLGWRGFLLAQFVFLIRGAQLCPTFKSKRVIVLAALGLAGTLYDQSLLRFFAPLQDAKFLPKIGWLGSDEKLGERTYANREAYEWLREHSAATALIQQNPVPVTQDTFYGLYSNRNTLAADTGCVTTFGGDPNACTPLQQILQPLFSSHPPTDSFEAACSKTAMVFVIARDTDAAWSREGTWVWSRTPIFANRFVRIFSCNAPVNRTLQ